MTMIQVRNVPDELHRKLKSRAAIEGVSLSEYALNELMRSASSPGPAELRARLTHRTPRSYGAETAAESTRAERDSR